AIPLAIANSALPLLGRDERPTTEQGPRTLSLSEHVDSDFYRCRVPTLPRVSVGDSAKRKLDSGRAPGSSSGPRRAPPTPSAAAAAASGAAPSQGSSQHTPKDRVQPPKSSTLARRRKKAFERLCINVPSSTWPGPEAELRNGGLGWDAGRSRPNTSPRAAGIDVLPRVDHGRPRTVAAPEPASLGKWRRGAQDESRGDEKMEWGREGKSRDGRADDRDGNGAGPGVGNASVQVSFEEVVLDEGKGSGRVRLPGVGPATVTARGTVTHVAWKIERTGGSSVGASPRRDEVATPRASVGGVRRLTEARRPGEAPLVDRQRLPRGADDAVRDPYPPEHRDAGGGASRGALKASATPALSRSRADNAGAPDVPTRTPHDLSSSAKLSVRFSHSTSLNFDSGDSDTPPPLRPYFEEHPEDEQYVVEMLADFKELERQAAFHARLNPLVFAPGADSRRVQHGFKVAVLRWGIAINAALMAGQLKTFGVGSMGDWEISAAIPETAQVDVKAQYAGAMRVREVLRIDEVKRRDRDYDHMETVLGKFPCFSKLPPSARYKLYACSNLEVFPRGTLLVHEKSIAANMYVILLGRCAEHHSVASLPGQPITTAILGVGGAIGDFAVNSAAATGVAREVRSSSVTCLMRTRVLRIDLLDFARIVREVGVVDNAKIEFLRKDVPALMDVPRSIIVELSYWWWVAFGDRAIFWGFGEDGAVWGVPQRFDSGELVVAPEDSSPTLFFIVKGKCRLLRQVTLVKTANKPFDAFNPRYTLMPSKGQILGPYDEVVQELFPVCILTAGQYFPPLALSPSDDPSSTLDQPPRPPSARVTTPLVTATSRLINGPHAVARAPMVDQPPYAVVALGWPGDKVECLAFDRNDFFTVVPSAVAAKLQADGVPPEPTRELQEKYMSSHGWRRNVGQPANARAFRDGVWVDYIDRNI
ncbi:hypothetical protein BDK51DRAFT_42924, partial [Blyttiomyces helicus]